MKKLQEGNDTDDFIDIQVRKLSYAEAASLKRDGRQPVVDQDKELEKSITDIEFMNAYKKQKRFDPEEYESKVEEAEEWVNEKRVPKRFSKHRRRGERDN
ncbi:DEKNAAC102035 [Brettanomyces naardenensis]|uniref:DEKNAAC102035 n=1 Tax=Brettanomyces naardenensis TaxID=13370 RepID=A0A448YJS5_BRENA|nr:DEKNAAC102035 [Brettanomyces naardenensis]